MGLRSDIHSFFPERTSRPNSPDAEVIERTSRPDPQKPELSATRSTVLPSFVSAGGAPWERLCISAGSTADEPRHPHHVHNSHPI